MRAIRKTIDGVTYDTGAACPVHQVWEWNGEGGLAAERTLYRDDGGRWFELRREAGQLYGALQPLSAAEAALWLSRHGEGGDGVLSAGEGGGLRNGPRLRAVEPAGA